MDNRWTMTSAGRRSGPRPRTCTRRRRTPRRRSSSTRRRGGALTAGSAASPRRSQLSRASGVSRSCSRSPGPGGIAVASALVGAIVATLAARQTTEKAGVAANALRALQQDAGIFLQIDLDVMAIEDARTTLQSLVNRQQQLSREAVIPSTRAWNRAKKQIEGGGKGRETRHDARRLPEGLRGRLSRLTHWPRRPAGPLYRF